MKILYKSFSGLADLSQIVWTPIKFPALAASWHGHNVLPLLWASPMGSGLLSHTYCRAFREHSLTWMIFNHKQRRFCGLFMGSVNIPPVAANQNVQADPESFFPVRDPSELGWHQRKIGWKASQRRPVFVSTPRESRTLQRNAGGFQMSGQNAGSVWRENWANIDSSVSQHWNPAGVWSCLFRARQKLFL